MIVFLATLFVRSRIGAAIAGVMVGVAVGVGIHFHVLEVDDAAFDEAQFQSYTDTIIGFEGGWVQAGDGDYAGIDQRAHPESPLWGWDLSEPTERIRREVYGIYRRDYYARMRIAEMPADRGFLVYDFGVHAGVHTSIRAAQRCLFRDARDQDGYIGPRTLAALHESADDFKKCITFARLEHYGDIIASHPEKSHDWHGWVNRAKAALDHSEHITTGD